MGKGTAAIKTAVVTDLISKPNSGPMHRLISSSLAAARQSRHCQVGTNLAERPLDSAYFADLSHSFFSLSCLYIYTNT